MRVAPEAVRVTTRADTAKSAPTASSATAEPRTPHLTTADVHHEAALLVLREADRADIAHSDDHHHKQAQPARAKAAPNSARRVSMDELVSRGHASVKLEKRYKNLGSLMAVVTEETYHAARGRFAGARCVVDPTGEFRRRWDVGCLALLLYVAVYTPVQVRLLATD